MADVLNKSICSRCLRFSSPPNNPSFSSFASFSSLKIQPTNSSLNCQFHGRKIVLQQVNRGFEGKNLRALPIQMSISIGKAWKWWEKGLQPNIKEISSAQDLVDSFLSAGDKLVIVDFFSPGCGGCKALHPKICQFAEMNPDILFLQVNQEEHKSMCYSLNVHVLPFFRFYRGAHGRLCSFSCTNATIKKFKDALAKHTPDRCSLGPPRGLEESELVALAANKDLSFNYAPKIPAPPPLPVPAAQVKPTPANMNPAVPTNSRATMDFEGKTLTTAGR